MSKEKKITESVEEEPIVDTEPVVYEEPVVEEVDVCGRKQVGRSYVPDW